MTVANQNVIHEEIMGELNFGNACYHSVQNLSSHLLSENLKIKIYTKLQFFLLFCMGLSNYGKTIE
jgi:hypothetical protein